MVCGYRRRFTVPGDTPRLFLRFDGAAHQAVVFVNGKRAGEHRGGYTAFTLEITDLVDRNQENLLSVCLDTREDPQVPPFGFVIDYLTYGGLYREVWLETSAQCRMEDLFVHTPTLQTAVVSLKLDQPKAAAQVRFSLKDPTGETLVDKTVSAEPEVHAVLEYPQAVAWTPDNPMLYRCEAALLD